VIRISCGCLGGDRTMPASAEGEAAIRVPSCDEYLAPLPAALAVQALAVSLGSARGEQVDVLPLRGLARRVAFDGEPDG